MDFIHPRRGKITLDEIIHDIQAFMSESANLRYKIVIGTDSQTTQQETVFVTAVIIHRIGKGARFYTRKVHSHALHDLRYRIYRETEYSLELMQCLKEKGFLGSVADWPVEVHLDVGQNGESRKMIQEVVGWVTAVGYTAKIKPEAYGASAVADRFTK